MIQVHCRNAAPLPFRRRRAAVDACISAGGRYAKPGEVMRPTPIVIGALHGVWKSAMRHAQKRAPVPGEKIDLDQARPRRHFLVSLPTEAVGETVDRHDLAERAARHTAAIAADAFEEIEPTRMRLGRRRGAHPAQDLFRIGQEGENGRGWSCDLDLALDYERFGHLCPIGELRVQIVRLARDKDNASIA
jgi:hypothetical protein